MTSPAKLAHDLVADLVDLYHDGRTTAPLLDRVRELLEPGRASASYRPAATARRSAAPLPVNSGAWNLLTDVHAEVRDHEATLRLAGLPPRERGRSDAATVAALQAVADLLDQLHPDLPAARRAHAALGRWHRQARTLTGHLERWARLTGYVCPGCECQSLRQRPGDGALVCVVPSCRDPQGNRYVWGLDELERAGLVVGS